MALELLLLEIVIMCLALPMRLQETIFVIFLLIWQVIITHASVNSGGAGVVIASGRSGNSSSFGSNIAWIRVGSRDGNSQAWVDSEMLAVTVHGDLA